MRKKVCLLTGATSGIGQSAALALAEKGYELYLVARNRQRADDTEKLIAAKVPSVEIHWLFGDLSCLDEVRKLASDFIATGKRLDLLFLNAGVTYNSRTLSGDGYEMMFAVNHLAPFLLTNLLLEKLCEEGVGAEAERDAGTKNETRIVMTASGAYRFVNALNIDDVNAEKKFSTFSTYGNSKLANILFIRQLSKKLLERAPYKRFSINCYHPGFVGTNLGTQTAFGKVLMGCLRPFARSSEKGAESGVFLATDASLTGCNGGYYYNCRRQRLLPQAEDDVMAEALWQLSEQLVSA